MNMLQQQETTHNDIQGTIIISVAPKDSSNNTPHKSRRKVPPLKRAKIQKQYDAHQSSQPKEVHQSEYKDGERNSESKMRGVDEQTMGEIDIGGLSQPYQFLSQRSPSIFTIFFPRFQVKSITFILSLVYVVMFIILLAYNYSRTQTDITWNCSLFQLQNKYFPRLRHNYQIWRVVISALFHSNIAHICLDLFALQVYGYFVQWYYGKAKYSCAIIFAAIFAHFLSTVVQKTSISTTPSSILFAVIGLKLVFLWQYRHYKKLMQRRSFLYILMAIIAGINLIPVFVVNNVDYSTHLGGIIVGLCFGISFYLSKSQQPSQLQKAIRFGSIILLVLLLLMLIALTFTDNGKEYALLNDNIDQKCNQ